VALGVEDRRRAGLDRAEAVELDVDELARLRQRGGVAPNVVA
jgi:hypothetical protein